MLSRSLVLATLLAPGIASATVRVQFSAIGDITVDGATQTAVPYTWTLDFDESTAIDNDPALDDGDFDDVSIEGMTVQIGSTTHVIDIGPTTADISLTHTTTAGGNNQDLLLITWVGGSPLMDGRARFYTDVGGLAGMFFADINDLSSAQPVSGANDNVSTHDSSISFSSSRPLITTTGSSLVMSETYLDNSETLTMTLQGGGSLPVASAMGSAIAASCPAAGPAVVTWTGAAPGEIVRIVGGPAGSDTLANGPCAGTPLQVNQAASFTATSNNNGNGFYVIPNLPPGACGATMQIVESSCSVSEPFQFE